MGNVILKVMSDQVTTFLKEVTHFEGEGLQHIALDSGGEQKYGSLRAVHVPVYIDALTLQQLKTTFVWQDLHREFMAHFTIHDFRLGIKKKLYCLSITKYE